MKRKHIALKCLTAFLAAGSLMMACGGGSSPQNNAGPTAILNGSSLANATSHWVAQSCVVKVELTSDGGFISAVTDVSGTTIQTQGTWTASGTNGAATTGESLWVNKLTNIAGSTSSGSFSAGVGVTDGIEQTNSICQFSLQSGGLTF